jgi:hypothetical protein
MKKVFLILALCLSVRVHATEIAGVQLAERAQLSNHNLVLNGAGLRTKLFFKIYVAAIYLSEKRTTADAIISDSNPQRLDLHFLRDLSDDQLLGAFIEAIKANNTNLEMTALDASIKQMSELFHQVKEVKSGDVITLDYLPASGTRISVNNVVRGTIAGDLFHRALLKAWLGDHPVQPDLKQKLLGGD